MLNQSYFNEYKKNIYRNEYLTFDDAWYDDGILYVEKLLDGFTKKDWLKLYEDVELFNEATNLKVAESLADISSDESMNVLLKLLTISNSVKILEEISTIIYEMITEYPSCQSKIKLTTKEQVQLEKYVNKSMVLSKYLAKVLNVSEGNRENV